MPYIAPSKRRQIATGASSDQQSGPSGNFNNQESGFNSGRGGYNSGRGGYNSGRGGYNNGYSRGGYNNGYSRGGYNNGGFGRGGFNTKSSIVSHSPHGKWIDGKHVPAPRNEAQEVKLFGVKDDPNFQATGINFDNYDAIESEATGEDVPEQITEFTTPPINELLMENIKLARFTKPTPVQKHSIPIIAAKRDLMACAQTGSGKTGGFLFPVLSECFDNGPQPTPPSPNTYTKPVYPTALVLAPTRELVSQIYDEANKFCYRSWVKPCVIYGGASASDQIRNMKMGCDLLVAAPGRLIDMIERGVVKLDNIKYLVLDEADRMLDMGFEPQIRKIVDESGMPDTFNRQTLMFSATFPTEIQQLAHDFLNNYIFCTIGRVGSTSENITQSVILVDEDTKSEALMDVLEANRDEMTLVFVQTKRLADGLTNYLISLGFSATAIHGDRSQLERERALSAFRKGSAKILVATSVAARGLDIPNVKLVINYDLPPDIDDYVHRIGRTGRAGNTGSAVSLFSSENHKLASDLVALLEEANQEVPAFLYEFFPRHLKSKRTSNNSMDIRKHGNKNSGSWGNSRNSGSTWGNSRNSGSTWGNARNNNGSSWGNARNNNGFQRNTWGNNDQESSQQHGQKSWW
ncbi:DEAD-box ATP-dependent RNA helicase [Hanseniaspora opuntiae]|jgi:ATP-dependent RNA helicase DDX3X